MPGLVSKCSNTPVPPADPSILAEAICDALGPKFELIATAIVENAARFDGDFLHTQFCTPDGEPIYVCKVTDPVTGVKSFEYHVIPDGGGTSEPYAGPREICETTPELVNAVACFEGKLSGVVCVDKVSMAVTSYVYTDMEGELVVGTGEPSMPYRLGSCDVRRECLKLWTLNAAGTYIECPGPNYNVEISGPANEVCAWYIGSMPVPDPRLDFPAGAEGVEYVLLPCDQNVIGEIPTTQEVVIPYDVNALPDVVENILFGSAELKNVCSLKVKAIVDVDCNAATTPTSVTFEDAAGNTHTEFVQPGCTEEFQCLKSDVKIDGLAVISGSTTEEIPIPESEC